MSEQTAGRLYFVPLAPARGVFRKHRALGMGVANVLAALLSADGFPITTMNYSPEEAEDPARHLLGGEVADRVWTAVGGSYDLKKIAPLKLVIVPPAAESAAGERAFSPADEENLEGFVREVREWLGEFGSGERQSGFRGPVARTLEQFAVDAWQNALIWLAHEVTTVVDKEFLDTLREGMEFFAERVGDPYAGRRVRELALELAPLMSAKRRPEGDGEMAGALKRMSRQLDPAGMEFIHPVLDLGVKRGADRPAFRACRGYVLFTLGRPGEALRDFEALEKAGLVRPALFAKGRAYFAQAEAEKAVAAFDAALKTSRPGELFTDVVLGQDAEPDPDGTTWRGMLLAARAEVELFLEKYAQAEKTATRALEEGARESDALITIARAQLDRGVRLLERGKPEEATPLLRKHMETIERVYEINPRFDEVEAGLAVAEQLGDSELLERWRRRERELAERHGLTGS
ncbi:MAG TPA: hypothetical protein VEY09_06040 [Pyrinomonadaceae bacterium]|nr:hypothetical protein [Pyrinomonadaceae bacterium]